MNKLWLLVGLFVGTAHAQIGTSFKSKELDYIAGQQFWRNYVLNPHADMNLRDVAVSGATLTRNTTSPLEGVADFAVTLNNNATDTVTWSLKTRDTFIGGQNCEARIQYSSTAIGSNVRLQVLQGSTVVAESLPLTNTGSLSTAFPVVLSFPCSTATSTVVLRNATGNSGSSTMRVDSVVYSRETNVGTVAQATFYAGMEQPGATGCGYTQTTSSGTTNYVDLGTGTGCSAWVTEGAATAVGTNDHRMTLNNMPPGVYLFQLTGTFYASSNNIAFFRLSDGTTSYQPQILQNNNAGTRATNLLSFTVRIDTAGSRTYRIQSSDDAAITTGWDNSIASGTGIAWKVYRYPTASEQVFRPDAPGVQWTAFTPTGSFTTNTTYTGFYRCTGDTIELQYRLAFTGAPNATTMFLDLPSGFTMDTTKVVGDEAVLGSAIAIDFGVAQSSGSAYKEIGGSRIQALGPTAVGWSNTAPYTFGASDRILINATVPVTAGSPCSRVQAPLLVGSVTSNSAGLERVERARIAAGAACSASPCTITAQSGSWLTSVTFLSTGVYELQIAAGIFSAPPSCSVMTNNFVAWDAGSTPSATAFRYNTLNSSGTLTNSRDMHVQCSGPR
jgi:hypothetical protein